MKVAKMRWTIGGIAALTALVAVQIASADLIADQKFTRGDGKIVEIFRTVASGTWTVPTGVLSLEVLVVGGGGGGCGADGGGGGGFYNTTSYSVTPAEGLLVAVGARGTGANNNTPGSTTDGGSSIFGTITAFGGGYGMLSETGHNASGGYSLNGGATLGVMAGGGYGGPGAGAGESTSAWQWFSAHPGGNGLTSSIISAADAGTYGIAYDGGYYAGGGANDYGAPLGGLGGGGQGNGSSGVDGLGGGGGGLGGNGGSGVVMVAYVIPEPGSLGLLGLFGGAVLLRLKRRK